MDDGYWEVKRFAYVCVCITSEYHGSVTVWNTSEEAWKDAKERADECIKENAEWLDCLKVYDGYEVVYQDKKEVIMCYKVFDMQELE